MKNILKLISISLVSLFVTFSFANASSGVFKLSHDLGFGKDTNLDAITKGRLFQVVIMTQNRLVRKDLKGVTSPELATDWSGNADATEWTFNLRKGVKFNDGSDFDAEDYVDWMMDNEGSGDLHSYIFNYMRSKRVSHWSID